MRYRLRRIGRPSRSDASYVGRMLHFIYDFDYDVLAIDKPRLRFATFASLLRRPRILAGVPRTGRLQPWWWLSVTLKRRLDLEPEFTKTVIFERLEKKGWGTQGTFHVRQEGVAYIYGRHSSAQARLFSSFAEALAAAMEHEKTDVHGFLYRLNLSKVALVAPLVTAAVTSLAALLFPFAVARLGDIMEWARSAGYYTMSQVSATLIIISVAWGFFKLRLRRQRFYGAIELGVGIGMAIAAVRSQSAGEQMELSLKIMAAVYVIIRGMVNIREAVVISRAKACEGLQEESTILHQAAIEPANAVARPGHKALPEVAVR